MTQDQIIKWARKADIQTIDHYYLQRFSQLVRAAALEEAAQVCDGVYYQHIGPQYGEVRYGIAACAKAIRQLKETK